MTDSVGRDRELAVTCFYQRLCGVEARAAGGPWGGWEVALNGWASGRDLQRLLFWDGLDGWDVSRRLAL